MVGSESNEERRERGKGREEKGGRHSEKIITSLEVRAMKKEEKEEN